MSQIKPAASDLAAELLLNKLMNKQVEAASGKTVTPASRAMSSSLSSEAYVLGLAAPTMEYGKAMVDVAQTGATDLAANFKKMQELLVGDFTGAKAYGVGLEIDEIYKRAQTFVEEATANGQNLYAGTGVELDAGMGQKIKILDRKIDLTEVGTGNVEFGTLATNMDTLSDAVTALKANEDDATLQTAVVTALKALNATTAPLIDQAIQKFNDYAVGYSYDIRQMDERATVVNTWSADLNEGAANQYISSAGGTSDLVDNILGTTTEA